MANTEKLTSTQIKKIFTEEFFLTSTLASTIFPVRNMDLMWANYVLSIANDVSLSTKEYIYFGALLASVALNEGHSFLSINNVAEQFSPLTSQMAMSSNQKENRLLPPLETDTLNTLEKAFIDLCNYLTDNVTLFRGALLTAKRATTPIKTKSQIAQPQNTNITTPLILEDETKLFINRYYHYELEVADKIKKYAKVNIATISNNKEEFAFHFDKNILSKTLPHFLGNNATKIEKIIFYTAINKLLLIICGGPGTGKTTIATKLLAFFLQNKQPNQLFKYTLLAFTGKASTRLKESFKQALKNIKEIQGQDNTPLLDINDIPAKTIHRFLIEQQRYARQHKQANDYYHLIIIDETSMLPVSLFAKLLSVLHENTRIILIGDKEQLPSVASSSILHALTFHYSIKSKTKSFWQDMVNFYQTIGIPWKQMELTEILPASADSPETPTEHFLCDNIIFLETIHRFQKDDGIHQLSVQVNKQNSKKALEILTVQTNKVSLNIKYYEHEASINSEIALKKLLKNILLPHYQKYFNYLRENNNPENALSIFNEYAILCPTRKGYGSASHINTVIEDILQEEQLIRLHRETNYYQGKVIMVLKNDYHLNVFNGDTGIFYRIPDTNDAKSAHHYQVVFNHANREKTTQQILASQIQNYTLAYAMTVHKSQGSEYANVLLILPDNDIPMLLTKELIYTAITRAKHSFTLIGKSSIFEKAINRKMFQYSSLSAKIW